MNHAEFEIVLNERINAIRSVLASKAKEYSSDEDRMHNFVRSGEILRCSPESAALAFAVKHLTSAMDLIASAESGTLKRDVIKEKFGDLINYLILIEAMLLHRTKEGAAKATPSDVPDFLRDVVERATR